jgi:DNA-binding MurR/RpiR family transcriptional regulator
LAERVSVGEATVSRFCRRLGLSDYLDLKISIASELSPTAMVQDTDGTADVVPLQ